MNNKPDRYRKGVPPAFPESQPMYLQDELTKLERVLDLSVDAHTKADSDITKYQLDFTTLYGTTESAAQSAADAIQAASDAVDAKAWALIYSGDSNNSKVVAQGYKIEAQNSSAASASSAAASLSSKEQAGSYATDSAASAAASSTYKLAAETSMNNAATSAAATLTLKNTVASYVTDAQNAASASSSSALAAQASRDAAGTSASAANTARSDALSAVTDASSYAGAANTSKLAAEAAYASANTRANAANTSANTASGYADAAGSSAGAANQSKLDAQAAYSNAANSASAANTSANNANASANAAGSSASAANQSKLDAAASEANALVSKNSAAQSSADALGYRNASAQDYTTLTARLNNAAGSGITVEAGMSANANSITGLQARWGVKITGANRVAGVQLNSSSTGTSSFDIEADFLNLYKPGTNEKMIYWDGANLVVRGNILATSITASAVNTLGSNAVDRPVIGNPTIVASGQANSTSGAYNGAGFTEFIDTGVNVTSSWSSASTDQYVATATISAGTSTNGGLNGWSEATVVVGDGLATNQAGLYPIDNRIYIKFTFSPGTGGGSIGVTKIDWKLARL